MHAHLLALSLFTACADRSRSSSHRDPTPTAIAAKGVPRPLTTLPLAIVAARVAESESESWPESDADYTSEWSDYPAWMRPRLHYAPPIGHPGDISAALTHRGVHHVWQLTSGGTANNSGK